MLTERQEEIVISGRDPVVTDVDKWANNLVPYVIEAETLSTIDNHLKSNQIHNNAVQLQHLTTPN